MTICNLIPGNGNLEREKLLEVLIRRIDHDFDGTLNRLNTAAGVIVEHPDNADLRRKLIETMKPSIDHAYHVTTTMRNLAFGNVKPRGFDLGSLLSGLKKYAAVKWGKDIDLEVDDEIMVSNFPSPIYVQAWNFISNAYTASFSGKNKTIELYGGLVSPSEEDVRCLGINSNKYTTDDDFVRIAVRDYGNGIPREILEGIFECGCTTKPSGQGVGLALVESTASMVHGFVRVETEVGKGSTFSLYFPKDLKT